MAKRSWIIVLFLFAFFLGPVLEAQAQSKIIDYFKGNSRTFLKGFGKNKEEYDDNILLYIGFGVPQVSYSHYIIQKSNAWHTTPVTMPTGSPDQFASITNPGGFEIGVGMPIRFRINHYLSFSSGVIFMFERGRYINNTVNGPRIEYTFLHDKEEKHIRMQRGKNAAGENFSTIEVPLHLKLYSDYKYFSKKSAYPYRLYLLGGGKFVRNFGSKGYYNQSDNFIGTIDQPLIFNNSHFNIDTGLGLDLHTKYSKLTLEGRYSQSLGELLNKKHKHYNPSSPYPYMSVIEKLSIRGVQISLILE